MGTVRKNKQEIPRELCMIKEVPLGYHYLNLYEARPWCHSFQSSMHHEVSVYQKSRKPDIIEFYNSTKGGVDALDLKSSNYSYPSKKRRWFNAIFAAILNIFLANGYTLWVVSNPNNKMSHREYIKSIAMSLVKPYVCSRVEKNQNLANYIREIMCELVGRARNLSTPNADKPGPSAP